MRKEALMRMALLAILVVAGCGASGLPDLQNVNRDQPTQVVSGLDQLPTNGPTASLSFKLHLYDVDESAETPVSMAAKSLGGGGGASGPGVNLQLEYRRRVSKINVALDDQATGKQLYMFSFPVINGGVYAHIEGLIPNIYKMTIWAVTAEGRLTLFAGENYHVDVRTGEDNDTTVYLQAQPVVLVTFKVKNQPGRFDPNIAVDVSYVSATINGETLSTKNGGIYFEGNLYFAANLQLNPAPASKLRFSYSDLDNNVYTQEINFSILALIDEVIAIGLPEIAYSASAGLNIDVVWPDQVGYRVALLPDSPVVQQVVAGSTVDGIKLNFITKDNLIVRSITLGVLSLDPYANGIANVMLYDGSTLLAEGPVPVGLDVKNTFILQSQLYIPAQSSKKLHARIDFSPWSSGAVPKSGGPVSIRYIGSEGIDVATARVIGDKTPLEGIVAYIFRSVPDVRALALPTATLTNGLMVLYKIAVEANAAGDIDLGKFAFDFIGDKVSLTNLHLVDVTTDNGAGQSASADEKGIVVVYPTLMPHIVPAGTSKIFELRGVVSGVTSGSYVTVRPLGDEGDVTSSPFITDMISASNFIWSDFSGYWHNGSIVKGFPLPQQMLILNN